MRTKETLVRWPDTAGSDETLFHVTADDADPCVFHLHGELDAATAAVVDELPITIRPGQPVVLDLADLSFCDSTGLTALIMLGRRVTEGSGELMLRDPQPAIRRLLDLTGVGPLLPISD